MALWFLTTKPKTLLARIKKGINAGHIQTWEYDDEGDFTHITADDQWDKKAFLKPSFRDDRLLFNIIKIEGKSLSRSVYAVYHGRFIEMAIAHVHTGFTRASATPSPIEGDAKIDDDDTTIV